MVGHLTLDQAIGVRIPVPQPVKRPTDRSVGRFVLREVRRRRGDSMHEEDTKWSAANDLDRLALQLQKRFLVFHIGRVRAHLSVSQAD